MSFSLKLAPSKDLPKPPPLLQILGPSFIILGLGLGSGEIILWPYLSTVHGLGMAWAIVVGISMQFVINLEVERYALIYGESIFVGFARWLKLLPLWFIISTFLGFGWPGIGMSSATLIIQFFPNTDLTFITTLLFLIIGLILTLGKQLYTTVETLQKYLITLGTPFIFFLTIFLAKPADWGALALGLVGQGRDFTFLPESIVIGTFLGAIAFSGAGGNLNLAQSFYVRDKGYGMGKFAEKIRSLFTSKSTAEVQLAGATFPLTRANITNFRKWWQVINLEHFFIFWVLGLVTMLTLSLLAYVATQGHSSSPEGINFVIAQASYIGEKTVPLFASLFLVTTGLMLAATQLTVLDSTSRIITENFLLLSRKSHPNVSRTYYIVLWLQIAFGITIANIGISQPRELIILGAIINAFAMLVYTILLLYFNNSHLPRPLRPSIFRNIGLTLTICFFGYFCFRQLFG